MGPLPVAEGFQALPAAAPFPRSIKSEKTVTQPDDSLRVSDAERDDVVRTLGDHAAVGRLTLDELEDRSGRALTAKTRGELATLTSDLPREAGQAVGALSLIHI